jgi:hypothetical protein
MTPDERVSLVRIIRDATINHYKGNRTMTHRKLLFTGALTATIGLLAGSSLAQVGQQQQQPRPSQASPINGEDFLSNLEGQWNVKVKIYDLEALEGKHIQRAGMREGQTTRPGVGQQNQQTQQQVQQHLEQAFTRAGVSQQEARSNAQQLAQRIIREQPDREQLQQLIQREMTQAGVSQQQAQQEAQRLAGQIQPLVQRDGQRDGRQLDPQDDRTAPPIRPDRARDRDQDQDRDRPGMRDEVQGEAQFTGEGTANRSWTLNETFLQEELKFSVESNGSNGNSQQDWQQRQQRQQGQHGQHGQQHAQDKRVDLGNGDEYEAMGLFAFEPANGDLGIVWADNTKSMFQYGIGKYDSAQQSMVFYTIDPDRVTLPGTSSRPGMSPAQRQTPGGPQQDRSPRPGQQDQTQRPGQQQDQHQRPGQEAGQDKIQIDQHGSRIVLRIVSENEHVVHVYRDNGKDAHHASWN